MKQNCSNFCCFGIRSFFSQAPRLAADTVTDLSTVENIWEWKPEEDWKGAANVLRRKRTPSCYQHLQNAVTAENNKLTVSALNTNDSTIPNVVTNEIESSKSDSENKNVVGESGCTNITDGGSHSCSSSHSGSNKKSNAATSANISNSSSSDQIKILTNNTGGGSHSYSSILSGSNQKNNAATSANISNSSSKLRKILNNLTYNGSFSNKAHLIPKSPACHIFTVLLQNVKLAAT